MVKTHCAYPTGSITSSRRNAPKLTPRFAPHDGHNCRVRQEKVSSRSRRQESHRRRANPICGLFDAGERELRRDRSDRLVLEAPLQAKEQLRIPRIASQLFHEWSANAVPKWRLARLERAIQPVECFVAVSNC
jgi:hypothetical protein